jgi:anti-sigma-K factor RskA
MSGMRLALLAAVVTASALTIGVGFSSNAEEPSREALARGTVREFFQSINTRHYERTCALMSARFYRNNDVPDRARCVLALRIGFTWAQSYRFTILHVRVHGHRAIVEAVVNGAPGRIVLLEESSRYRVLSVGGS